MSRMMKILIITVVVGLVVCGSAFGYAATLSTSNVKQLGSTTQTITANWAVTNVTYVPDPADYSSINEVDLTFSNTSPNAYPAVGSKIYVELTGTGSLSGTPYFNPAFTVATSQAAQNITLGADVVAADITGIIVTVVGP